MRRAFTIVSAIAVALAGLMGYSGPAAAAEQLYQKVTHTVSVIYWWSNSTGTVTFAGPNGSLTGSGSSTQPFLILDYRLATPSNFGLHLYYGPYLGASNVSSGATQNMGLWGGEITYDLLLHPTKQSLLILDLFAGYGQQYLNTYTTGLLGNPITSQVTTGGFYPGVNAFLPVSQQLAFYGSVSYYPWGFATINLSAPGIGLTTSATGSAPQWLYGVGVRYATASQWSFSLGYQWDTISIAPISVPIRLGGGQTLGGTVCPCNTSYSGITLSVGKTF